MCSFNHNSGQIFDIDDARIYCEIIGNAEAPPLLMLHGGLGNIEDFNAIAPALAADFKIIGIDSRGHGKSTLGTNKLTYERLEKDILCVMEKLNIKTVSILGFSDGGIVAYRLATNRSVTIDKLITLGSEWQLKNDDPVIPVFKKVTAQGWREKFPQTFDSYQQLNPEPDFERLVNAAVGMWLDQSATGYPANTVKNITTPLLLIRGDDDHLVSLKNLVELRDQVNGAKFMNIAFAGHMVFVEQKEIVLAVTKQFLLEK